ncbi:hypothetical protein [Cyclobacterium marinum]|uniref:hypothetical protein n=1 Tax=Cyclobacterium marinum TaxID=104 RepID=UPI0011ED66D5|nr:hypothetical protein [Cyclobacterium marinum]MBI0399950.1 hypothetical protein [Cyclobacterium marinum]
MESLDNLKNRLIDRIMVSENEKLLEALESILNSTETEERLALNSYHIEMLLMSEKDIENGNLFSEANLIKVDSEWMD